MAAGERYDPGNTQAVRYHPGNGDMPQERFTRRNNHGGAVLHDPFPMGAVPQRKFLYAKTDRGEVWDARRVAAWIHKTYGTPDAYPMFKDSGPKDVPSHEEISRSEFGSTLPRVVRRVVYDPIPVAFVKPRVYPDEAAPRWRKVPQWSDTMLYDTGSLDAETLQEIMAAKDAKEASAVLSRWMDVNKLAAAARKSIDAHDIREGLRRAEKAQRGRLALIVAGIMVAAMGIGYGTVWGAAWLVNLIGGM